jgi:hypothetical protein
MLFCRTTKPNSLAAIGLLAVSASSGWRAVSAHPAPLTEELIDFLLGLGIGILLVAVWRKRRCGIAD